MGNASKTDENRRTAEHVVALNAASKRLTFAIEAVRESFEALAKTIEGRSIVVSEGFRSARRQLEIEGLLALDHSWRALLDCPELDAMLAANAVERRPILIAGRPPSRALWYEYRRTNLLTELRHG